MTHPLAALLDGVPRYSFTGKKLQETGWMHEDAVLAALEAVPVPPDLVEAGKVAGRLENADPFQFPFSAADAELAAAATIRALIAQNAAQAAQIAGLEVYQKIAAEAERVAAYEKERAEAAEAEAHACGAERELWKDRAEAAEAERDNLSDNLELERALTDGAHRRAKAAEAKVAELTKERDEHRANWDRAFNRNAALDEENTTLQAEVERLRGALQKINVGEGWAAQIARAALEGKA